MIENSLKDSKPGDILFHSVVGNVNVAKVVFHTGGSDIVVDGGGIMCHTFDAETGLDWSLDDVKYPTLFKSIDHLIKYFTEVRDEN